MIHDELLLDGSSRLNMATFVTTWMDPEAERLMSETFDKNMIDKDEYPQTAEIERCCVNIVAELFNAPTDEEAVGVSTIGSSEAVMLDGLAMKWQWRQRREAAGLDTDRPNMVMGSNVQVGWEKFCRYWDVEARYVPITEDRFVDAASGGFVAPFLHPDLEWDFRLPQVKSINVYGHKYGLVYPGLGFVVWRSKDDLPEDLVFHVNYLGGDMPTFTLNFSRPGNQIIGQYYNFVRLGRQGYTEIMERLRDTAMHLSQSLAEMGPFDVISDGSAIPVLALRIIKPSTYTVFHVSDQLRRSGWQVPAYTMPADATKVSVLRIVVREGFGMDLADSLLEEFRKAIDYLETHPPVDRAPAGFSHT